MPVRLYTPRPSQKAQCKLDAVVSTSYIEVYMYMYMYTYQSWGRKYVCHSPDAQVYHSEQMLCKNEQLYHKYSYYYIYMTVKTSVATYQC